MHLTTVAHCIHVQLPHNLDRGVWMDLIITYKRTLLKAGINYRDSWDNNTERRKRISSSHQTNSSCRRRKRPLQQKWDIKECNCNGSCCEWSLEEFWFRRETRNIPVYARETERFHARVDFKKNAYVQSGESVLVKIEYDFTLPASALYS